MSEWIEIKDQVDVELSEDGEHIEILFGTNEWGSQYVEVPIKFILGLGFCKEKRHLTLSEADAQKDICPICKKPWRIFHCCGGHPVK